MMTAQTSFQTVLDALKDKKEFPKRLLSHFSDLDALELKALLEVWPRIALNRKLTLLNGLVALLDSDTLVSFDDLGRALLNDPTAEVRANAIRLLAEADDEKLIPTLIDILKNDPELEPRLEAATLLGEFLLLGELEELSAEVHHQIEDALLSVANGEEHAALRRMALEALGFSSRAEVETLIRSSFNRAEKAWVVSSLIAMGRNSDDQWAEQVVGRLLDEDLKVRLAAVQAAGELRTDEARQVLLKLLEDEEDDEIISATVWSLSQIGGEDVRPYLESLMDQTDDEDIIAFIEDALENLDMTEELDKFDLLAFDEDEIDEE
ncbi:MAG: HEAT repeat domain-containing protein [Anaerolineales bacterium]|nr:HEAT repeat domain-containing protein [Anaerolineales bacterium]